MPDNLRASERERQEADRYNERYVENQRVANDANNALWHEVQDAWGNRWNSVTHRISSYVDSGVEAVQDQLTRASHIIPDAIVRATHDPNVQARDRILYPQDQANRPAAQAPHAEAARPPVAPAHHGEVQGARPATHNHHVDARPAAHPSHGTDNPSTAHRPAAQAAAAHADYVVRRGDSISRIVRADEERRHPGVHNARQEQLRVQALVNQHGETILPGMHIDLTA